MNWWVFPLVVVGCVAMARKRWLQSAGSPNLILKRIAAAGFVAISMFVCFAAIPFSWTLQEGYRAAQSVGLRTPTAAKRVPEHWRALAAAFDDGTRPGLRRYSVSGVVDSATGPLLLLARIERNHNLVKTLTDSLQTSPIDFGKHTNYGPASAVFGCSHTRNQSFAKSAVVGGPDEPDSVLLLARCEWRHEGSTAVIIPLANDVNWAVVRDVSQSLKGQVLVADEGRYHPFQLGGKLALDLLVALLFGVISIVGHELSHAAMARLVGSQVIGVTIGIGPTVWKGIFRGVEVEWRKIPVGGYVRHQRPDDDTSRWRPVFIAAAGPGFNLATGAGLMVITKGMSTLSLIGFGLGLVNLIPYSVVLPEVNIRVGTDGYQILRHLRQARPLDKALPIT
jgi:Peptidase family M50